MEARMEHTDMLVIDREKSLNLIGKAYIDMKNGDAAGFIVTLREGKVSLATFDMDEVTVIGLMIGLIESSIKDEGGNRH
jgi:hypothetical protein